MLTIMRSCDDFLRDCFDEPDAADANRRGLELYQQGDLPGAAEEFRRATECDPGSAEAWNNAGVVRMQLGDPSGAIADYRRALEIAPGYADARNNLARALDLTGDPSAAHEYDRAMECAEGDFRAVVLHNRAMMYRAAGARAEALRDFDEALAIAPDQLVTLLARGETRKGVGDLDGAMADFDRALSLADHGASAEVLHRRGGVRVLRGDFAGAVVDYDRALAIDPGLLVAYISRGHAYYHLRSPGRALVDYRQALRMAPEAAAREIARFCVEELARDPENVLKNCDQHLRIDPKDAVALGRRGVALNLLGRDAGTDLLRFATMVPDLVHDLVRVLEIAARLRDAAR
jgi:tetratricopeptide (TPR) repeat protein